MVPTKQVKELLLPLCCGDGQDEGDLGLVHVQLACYAPVHIRF